LRQAGMVSELRPALLHQDEEDNIKA